MKETSNCDSFGTIRQPVERNYWPKRLSLPLPRALPELSKSVSASPELPGWLNAIVNFISWMLAGAILLFLFGLCWIVLSILIPPISHPYCGGGIVTFFALLYFLDRSKKN